MNFIECWCDGGGGPTGIWLGIVAVLFAGIPAAALALGLAHRARTRRRRWREWQHWFQAGFVVQGSSLILASAGILTYALDAKILAPGELVTMGFLAADVAASGAGVLAWRALHIDAAGDLSPVLGLRADPSRST